MAAQTMKERAYQEAFRRCLQVVEKNVVPDIAVRTGIRYLLSIRQAEVRLSSRRPRSCRRCAASYCPCAPRAAAAQHPTTTTAPAAPSPQTTCSGEEHQRRLQAFVDELKTMPIAVETDAANEQHYEVPTQYFNAVLGARRKYSSCLYAAPSTSLDEAEDAMLALCSERAGLVDGQAVLELGCGWGSWSLYMAARYPGSRITAVSNSRTQKEYIDAQAAARGLTNLTIITGNLVTFQAPGQFDRVVSVECFEHMKNYGMLLSRVASWLRAGGKL